MKKDYTHIHMILDRSGSMELIKHDTIGGVNSFIDEQSKVEGKATFSLVQFDTVDSYEVINDFVDISDARKLDGRVFMPRGGTPLLDALGRGMNDLDEKLRQMKKKQRPEFVVFVVVTDGQENNSREFRKDAIEKMIKSHDGWQFVYLSADLNAISDALSYGFAAHGTQSYTATPEGVRSTYIGTSQAVADFRMRKTKDVKVN